MSSRAQQMATEGAPIGNLRHCKAAPQVNMHVTLILRSPPYNPFCTGSAQCLNIFPILHLQVTMANHARIEELSDSDPDEVDISSINTKATSQSASSNPTLMHGGQIPSQRGNQVTRENSKHWQCLYPLYFDLARKRAEGRRVSTELAVANPLARELADAVWSLNLQPVLEPDKTHPRDWANPGRVRVLIKEDGKTVSRGVKNSTC